jgi:excisionase family DNA binding protein
MSEHERGEGHEGDYPEWLQEQLAELDKRLAPHNTVADVADYFNVSEKTVHRLVRDGQLDLLPVRPNAARIPRASVRAYLIRLAMGALGSRATAVASLASALVLLVACDTGVATGAGRCHGDHEERATVHASSYGYEHAR